MTRVTPRPKEVVLLILGGNDLKKLLHYEQQVDDLILGFLG